MNLQERFRKYDLVRVIKSNNPECEFLVGREGTAVDFIDNVIVLEFDADEIWAGTQYAFTEDEVAE